jgi:hypothetical protein
VVRYTFIVMESHHVLLAGLPAHSRKYVPKRKGGIPLDVLLAAQAAGNDRLGDLRTRYGADIVPTTVAPRTSAASVAAIENGGLEEGPGRQFVSSRATPRSSRIAEPRLVGYARVSTDEQTTRQQLDALRAAGCAVIHEDAASGVSGSRPGLSHRGPRYRPWRSR